MKKETIKKTLALSTLFLTTIQAKDINFIKTEAIEKNFYIDYSIPVNVNLYSSMNEGHHNNKDVSDNQNEWTDNLFEEETIHDEYVINMNYKIYDENKNTNSYKTYKMDTSMKFDLSNKIPLFSLSDLGESKYDAINSQFYENIQDITSELEMQPLYQEKFNYKNSYVSLTTGINQENDKYDFYNMENTYTEISFAYKF